MSESGPSPRPFVPDGFMPPAGLDHPDLRLRPRGPEHNASDYAAWTSSVDHIISTPGFAEMGWPHPMTLEENLADLVRHAEDFERRTGFTYTVLAPTDGDPPVVIGCVYIYPAVGFDARVRSWVRVADARLDPVLARVVSDWLAEAWPFEHVDDAGRIAG